MARDATEPELIDVVVRLPRATVERSYGLRTKPMRCRASPTRIWQERSSPVVCIGDRGLAVSGSASRHGT